MFKITTNDCQIFLSSHYGEKILNKKVEKWQVVKKYKNYHGHTCRDFVYPEKNLKAIVIFNPEKNSLSIIENQDFNYFLSDIGPKPLFYYVPVITKYGVSFYFIKTVIYNATQSLDLENGKQQQYLSRRLIKEFSQDSFIIHENLITIFDGDFETTIKKLESLGIHYNESIFNLLDKEYFVPLKIDLSLIMQISSEYAHLNTEDSISIIFNLVSTNKELDDKIYCQIKSLLSNITLDELYSLENIINGFRMQEDKKLSNIINFIMNKKKNKHVVDTIHNEQKIY